MLALVACGWPLRPALARSGDLAVRGMVGAWFAERFTDPQSLSTELARPAVLDDRSGQRGAHQATPRRRFHIKGAFF